MTFFPNSGELKCSKCGESAANAEALQRHVSARHLEWTPWHCPYCNVYASIESLMVQHMRNSHAGLDHLIKYSPDPNKAKSLNSTMNKSIRLSVEASSKARTHPSSAVEKCTKFLKSSPEISSQTNSPKKLSRISCKICQQSVLHSNTTAHIASEHLHQPLFLCNMTECSKKRFFSSDSAKLHASKSHGRLDVIRDSGLASRSQLRIWWKRCFSDGSTSQVECRRCGLIEHTSLQKHVKAFHMKSALFRCPQCKHSSKWSENIRRHQLCVHKSRARDPVRLVSNEREFHRIYADCKLRSTVDQSGAQSDNGGVAASRKTPLSESIADEVFMPKSKTDKVDIMRPSTRMLTDSLSPVECNVCGRMCTNRADFDKHVLQTHWRRPLYRCPFCSFRSKLLDQADRHIVLAHTDRDYEQPDNLHENQQALEQYLQTILR